MSILLMKKDYRELIYPPFWICFNASVIAEGFKVLKSYKSLKTSAISIASYFTGISSIDLTNLLQLCVDRKLFDQGRAIHAFTIKLGQFDSSIHLGNRLMNFYAKTGDLRAMDRIFHGMQAKDVCSWNTLISGYCNGGLPEDARQVFEKMPQSSQISWNTMIAGFVQKGYWDDVLIYYQQMKCTGFQGDKFTFASVLGLCQTYGGINLGRQLHGHIVKCGLESDAFVGSSLVDMYAKCRSIEDAKTTFARVSNRDCVLWTTMIAGFSQCRHGIEALKLFQEMRMAGLKCNELTYAAVLSACASISSLEQARQIHGQVLKFGWDLNPFISSALVDVYAKCEQLLSARALFDRMSYRDIVSWNTMLVGYAQNGYAEDGLKLYSQLQGRNDVKPDEVTFTGILNSWGILALLRGGRQTHCCVVKSGFESNIFVGSSLVDLYFKCGSTEDACLMFGLMPQRNVVTWNAMIGGHAVNGHGADALKLFDRMVSESLCPNESTFVSILQACNFAGLVEEGIRHFQSMQVYNVVPTLDHYACLIDLLSRAGYFVKAKNIISSMPIEPSSAVWSCLLGACKIHGNIELGEVAAQFLFKMEPDYAAPYVLLSNMYADAGRWQEAARLRKLMKERGVKKAPGCSWIDVKGCVHVFLAEERS